MSIVYIETFPGLIPGFNGTMLLVVGDVPSTTRRLRWLRESQEKYNITINMCGAVS